MNFFKRLLGGKKSGLETITTESHLVGDIQQRKDFVFTPEQEDKLKRYAEAYVKSFPGIYFQADYANGMAKGQIPKRPEILLQPEPSLEEDKKQYLKLMGQVLGHIGFPAEEVRTLHALDSHCKVQGIVGFLSTSNEKLTVQTRLGKYGVYKLDYDLRGAFRDFGAEFLVEGPVFV